MSWKSAARRARVILAGAALTAIGVLVIVSLAACAGTSGPAPTAEAPWKGQGSFEIITPAPDAGGILSFRNCPTLDEARTAIPAIAAGPDANAVPFKTMVLQCSYRLPGIDIQGRDAGIGILVFDEGEDGHATWDSVLEAATRGTPTALPGFSDDGFATRRDGRWDVWVTSGRFTLHLLHTNRDDLALGEMAGLAKATVVALLRPPR